MTTFGRDFAGLSHREGAFSFDKLRGGTEHAFFQSERRVVPPRSSGAYGLAIAEPRNSGYGLYPFIGSSRARTYPQALPSFP